MKACPICGDEIKNGENGCAMYYECFKCRPIRYNAPPRRGVHYGDYEELILAAQEDFND